ncbi:MAG TPA: hypothetical protein VGI80_10215 [Pyrinomonadaceae bacterium]
MKKLYLAAIALLVCASGLFAQPRPAKPKPMPTPKVVSSAPRQVLFAVVNSGTTLEPIGYVSKGKFSETVNGGGDKNEIKSFAKTYYKTGQSYPLIFGGAKSGTVSVKTSNANAECAPNTANIRTSGSVHLGKLIMGLGTNVPVKTAPSTRRKPTAGEKAEADTIATAEFLKEKLTAKILHYQNLTAINVGGSNGDVLVGSYWIEIDKLTRGLLFFIAEKGKNGKYTVGYRDYRKIDQGDMMSGTNISAVDDGMYHELLLDYLDINGDGVAEIFTYQQGFEGAGYTAFQKSGSHWVKAYEFNNYHCGY